MKSTTTLASVVLLAASLGFTNSAMARGNYVGSYPDSTTTGGSAAGGVTTTGPAATATASANAPATANVAAGTGAVSITFSPTLPAGATLTSATATNGATGTYSCTPNSPAAGQVTCNYQATGAGHGVPTDVGSVLVDYTLGGVTYYIRGTTSINIAPYSQS